MEGDWVPSIVETALKYDMVSRKNTLFEPDREITRAEAGAMIMSAVCLTVPEAQKYKYSSWQEGIYELAQSN